MADWRAEYSLYRDRLPFSSPYREDEEYYSERSRRYPRQEYDLNREYYDERYPRSHRLGLPPYWERDWDWEDEERWPLERDGYHPGYYREPYHTPVREQLQRPPYPSPLREYDREIKIYNDFTSDLTHVPHQHDYHGRNVMSREHRRHSLNTPTRQTQNLIRDRSPTSHAKHQPTLQAPKTEPSTTFTVLRGATGNTQPTSTSHPVTSALTANKQQKHYCPDCDVYASNEQHLISHFKGRKHLNKVGKEVSHVVIDEVQGDPQESVTVLMCKICGKHGMKDKINEEEHVKTQRHQAWSKTFFKKNSEKTNINDLFKEISMPEKEVETVLKLEENGDGYRCDVCDVTVNTYPTYKKHIMGAKHKKIAHREENQAKYHCDVCDVDIQGESCYKAHLQGQKHRKNSNKLENPPAPAKYECDVCGISCNSQNGYEQHMNGKPHLKKVKKLNDN